LEANIVNITSIINLRLNLFKRNKAIVRKARRKDPPLDNLRQDPLDNSSLLSASSGSTSLLNKSSKKKHRNSKKLKANVLRRRLKELD